MGMRPKIISKSPTAEFLIYGSLAAVVGVIYFFGVWAQVGVVGDAWSAVLIGGGLSSVGVAFMMHNADRRGQR